MIAAANSIGTATIKVLAAIGGTEDWEEVFPKQCALDTAKSLPPCRWFCDTQSCDQCHPKAAMIKGMGL